MGIDQEAGWRFAPTSNLPQETIGGILNTGDRADARAAKGASRRRTGWPYGLAERGQPAAALTRKQESAPTMALNAASHAAE